MKGPPSASFASPDLLIAPANSLSNPTISVDCVSPSLLLLLTSPLVLATKSFNAFKNGTILANTLAPNAFENIGHISMNNGADNVCMSFLASRGSNTPSLALPVIDFTNIEANTMASTVDDTS